MRELTKEFVRELYRLEEFSAEFVREETKEKVGLLFENLVLDHFGEVAFDSPILNYTEIKYEKQNAIPEEEIKDF